MSEYFRSYVRHAAKLSRFADDFGKVGNLDLNAALWALGGAESTFGKFAHQPRFEKAYARGGRYFLPDLDKQFGDAAAMSYGPWQVMYCNAHKVTGGYITPDDMKGMTYAAQVATVKWLDHAVLARGARSMREIADAWNTGSHRDNILPAPEYLEKVERFYLEWSD